MLWSTSAPPFLYSALPSRILYDGRCADKHLQYSKRGLLWGSDWVLRFTSWRSLGIPPTSVGNGSSTAAGPAVTAPGLTWDGSWPGECTMCPMVTLCRHLRCPECGAKGPAETGTAWVRIDPPRRSASMRFAALGLPLLREIPIPQSSACACIIAAHPVPIKRMALTVPRLGNGAPGRQSPLSNP
jgi:hypothetical protein